MIDFRDNWGTIKLMSLANDYKRQFSWRDWPTIFDALPPLEGQTVLDLGCGVGDLAAEFVARGARVIGVDMNEELLRVARSRQLANAEFRMGDLRTLADFGIASDGIWCSFTAAYFPDLPTVLAAWTRNIKAGGWIALTEIDDLFGHEPLSDRTRALLRSYAEDALASGRYDFHMGRKLRDHLEHSGFTVLKLLARKDQELSFSGPASPEVLDAWQARFDRMKLLRDFCGPNFQKVREEFLACLMRTDHRSLAKVYCCIAKAVKYTSSSNMGSSNI
jgi:ubiquinone/menaquinone biosynthesis C-methylase UbiE